MSRWQTYYVIFNIVAHKARVRTMRTTESDLSVGEVLLKVTLKLPQTVSLPEQTFEVPQAVALDSATIEALGHAL